MNYVSVMLPRLAEALQEAADIYNQAAVRKVAVDGPLPNVEQGKLELTIGKWGFRFEDSGKGFVRVFEFGSGDTREWARVEPKTDRSGRLVAWRERTLFPSKRTNTRSMDGLSQTYLLNLLRRRLLSKLPT